MRISINTLLNLPVETQSGRSLGRISALDVDAETQRIATYYVKTGLIKELWHQELMISPTQVVSISAEKMVVEDTTTPEPVTEFKAAKLMPQGAK